jgi:hypothetical protein
MPETVFGIHGNNIISKEIPLDKKLIEILGRI